MVQPARLLMVGALLVATMGVPAAGQADDEDGSLGTLCADAPDEATRESCQHLAATILSSAKATTPWPDFDTRVGEVLAAYSSSRLRMEGVEPDLLALAAVRSGIWVPRDPATGRSPDPTKTRQVKAARAVAGAAASDLRDLLLTVTPEDCYSALYAALWGLVSSWDTCADGRGSVERLVGPALEDFGQASQLTFCGEPMWHIDVGPPETMG